MLAAHHKVIEAQAAERRQLQPVVSQHK